MIDDALDIDPVLRPSPAALRLGLRAAEAELADEGLVEPATLRRVGLATTRRRSLFRLRLRPPGAERRPARIPRRIAQGSPPAASRCSRASLASSTPPSRRSPPRASPPRRPRWLGWMIAVIGLCGWLVSPEADEQGTALVLAAAALPVPFLLPRAGFLWSVPVAAPLLGTIALGPAFIGIAALASTTTRRWASRPRALVARARRGAHRRRLLFGSPDRTMARSTWEGSISAAASDALQPAPTTPALAPALVWAAGAVLLALAVRGRWLAVDLLGAGLCTAALVVAHVALGDVLAADVALDHARGGVAGASGRRSWWLRCSTWRVHRSPGGAACDDGLGLLCEAG